MDQSEKPQDAGQAVAAFIACLGDVVSGMTPPAQEVFLAGIRSRAENLRASGQIPAEYEGHLFALCDALENYVYTK